MSDEHAPPPSSGLRDPFAPRSRPAPVPPKPKRDRSKLVRGLAIAGAVLALGAIGYGAYRVWPRRAPALPMPAADLPASTTVVRKFTTSFRIAGSRERTWSHYAVSCGGSDIFALADRLDVFRGPEELGDVLRDPKTIGRQIECGKTLAERIGEGTSYELELGDALHPIGLASIAMDDLETRAGLAREKEAGFSVFYCTPGEGDACAPAPAIGKLDRMNGFWLMSDAPALVAFPDAAKGEHLAAKDAVAFENLAREFARYDFTTIGSGKARVEFEAFDDLEDASEDVFKARAAFDTKLADLGAHWATGIPLLEEGEMRLDVVASNEGEAKEIFGALKDLRVSLKHAEPFDFAGADRVTRKYRTAYDEMVRRALGDAEPILDGSTVHLVLALVAKKEEADAFATYREDIGKKRAPVTELIRDLAKGDRPSDKTLHDVGGSDLVDAVNETEHDAQKRARTDAPPPADVEGLADVRVAGGGALDSPTGDEKVYRFDVSLAEASAIVDEEKRLLREAGWELVLDRLLQGPEFHALKGGRRIGVSFRRDEHTLVIAFRPS